jgi:phosphoglycerate dehydrogenase-like enzyme
MFRIWFERSLPSAHAPLLEDVDVAVGPASKTPEDPLSELPGSRAIIASSYIKFDGAAMDRASTLRVISRIGIGLDQISIAEGTALGIAVCNAPDGPTFSTAEHAIALLLAAAKKLKRSENMLRSGAKVTSSVSTRELRSVD